MGQKRYPPSDRVPTFFSERDVHGVRTESGLALAHRAGRPQQAPQEVPVEQETDREAALLSLGSI